MDNCPKNPARTYNVKCSLGPFSLSYQQDSQPKERSGRIRRVFGSGQNEIFPIDKKINVTKYALKPDQPPHKHLYSKPLNELRQFSLKTSPLFFLFFSTLFNQPIMPSPLSLTRLDLQSASKLFSPSLTLLVPRFPLHFRTAASGHQKINTGGRTNILRDRLPPPYFETE